MSEDLLDKTQAQVMYSIHNYINELDDEETKEFMSNISELVDALDEFTDEELILLIAEKNRIIEQIEKEEEAKRFYQAATKELNDIHGPAAPIAGLTVDEKVSYEF